MKGRLGLRDAQHLPLACVEVLLTQRAELTVDSGQRRGADLDVKIRSFSSYQLPECLVDVEHGCPIGVPAPSLETESGNSSESDRRAKLRDVA